MCKVFIHVEKKNCFTEGTIPHSHDSTNWYCTIPTHTEIPFLPSSPYYHIHLPTPISPLSIKLLQTLNPYSGDCTFDEQNPTLAWLQAPNWMHNDIIDFCMVIVCLFAYGRFWMGILSILVI